MVGNEPTTEAPPKRDTSIASIKALKESGDPQWSALLGEGLVHALNKTAVNPLLNGKLHDVAWVIAAGELLKDIPANYQADPKKQDENAVNDNFRNAVRQTTRKLYGVETPEEYGVAD